MRPPVDFIELGGHERNLQYERPDVWIRPDESVVLEVKAASIAITDQFRVNMTLRFPRFKKLRGDKDWKTALSIQEFLELKSTVENEQKQKALTVDNSRRKRPKANPRKPLTVAGCDEIPQNPFEGPSTEVFKGLSFCKSISTPHAVKTDK
jgi:DNA ligase-4